MQGRVPSFSKSYITRLSHVMARSTVGSYKGEHRRATEIDDPDRFHDRGRRALIETDHLHNGAGSRQGLSSASQPQQAEPRAPVASADSNDSSQSDRTADMLAAFGVSTLQDARVNIKPDYLSPSIILLCGCWCCQIGVQCSLRFHAIAA